MDECNDTGATLPLKGDFDPWVGCLDALNAWMNFGGLSRSAAYEKFCENPGYYPSSKTHKTMSKQFQYLHTASRRKSRVHGFVRLKKFAAG
jgi:hypothetical protein